MDIITDYKKLKEDCIKWIQKWFKENGEKCCAIVGISGGKDSTIVATLCAEALGKSSVIGVSLPGEGQTNDDALKIANHLGISLITIPIDKYLSDIRKDVPFLETDQARINLPPRLRMTMLYYVAQTFNGRVVGTSNASENYLGYCTAWGDQVSDCEPLANLTVSEVKKLGHELGLPYEWIEKTPDDGLPGSCPDEEKFGFTYKELDRYIRGNYKNVSEETAKKIDERHEKNLFKMNRVMINSFMPDELFDYLYGNLDSYDEFKERLDDFDYDSCY